MILPKIGRTAMIKGVSALGVLALVTIGMAGIGSFGDIPEDMLGKSDAELEALMDPLAEELAYDHSRRALAEYRASKGLFSCEGECIENKRRWLEAERDLMSLVQQRAAARKAARRKAAGGGSGTVLSMADRQAAAKARQAARAAKRRGINVKTPPAPAPAPGGAPPAPATTYMSPRAAAQARAAERKRQRAAEKAARVAAAQAAAAAAGATSGGGGASSGPRLTPAQKRAARKAARDAERAANKPAPAPVVNPIAAACRETVDFQTAVEAKLETMSDDELAGNAFLLNQHADEWVYMYDDGVAWNRKTLAEVDEASERSQNPGSCTDFIRLPLALDVLGSNGYDPGEFLSHYEIEDKTSEAAQFEARLEAAKFQRCVSVALFRDLRDRQQAGEMLTDLVQSTRADMEAARAHYDEVVASENNVCMLYIYNTPPPTPAPTPLPPGHQPTAAINFECQTPEPDFFEEVNSRLASMTREEIDQAAADAPYFIGPTNWSYMNGDSGPPVSDYDAVASMVAGERSTNPSSCFDVARYELTTYGQESYDSTPLVFLNPSIAYEAPNAAIAGLDSRLQAAKLTKCIATKLWEQTANDATEAAMNDASAAYDQVKSEAFDRSNSHQNQMSMCAMAWWGSEACPYDANHLIAMDCAHTRPPTPAPVEAEEKLTTLEIRALCEAPSPDFVSAADERESTMSQADLDLAASHATVNYSSSTTSLAKVAEAEYRFNNPSSCTDIIRFPKITIGGTDAQDFYFIPDFDTTGRVVLQRWEDRAKAAKLMRCITTKLYEQTPNDATQDAMETASSDYETIVAGGKGNGFCATAWEGTTLATTCANNFSDNACTSASL